MQRAGCLVLLQVAEALKSWWWNVMKCEVKTLHTGPPQMDDIENHVGLEWSAPSSENPPRPWPTLEWGAQSSSTRINRSHETRPVAFVQGHSFMNVHTNTDRTIMTSSVHVSCPCRPQGRQDMKRTKQSSRQLCLQLEGLKRWCGTEIINYSLISTKGYNKQFEQTTADLLL